MVNMTIKGLPDAVYRQLKKAAHAQGRSLNAQVIHVLRTQMDEGKKFEKMRTSRADLERLVASLPPMSDSTPLIREDRMRDE